VLRGSSWYGKASGLRSAVRSGDDPRIWHIDRGFRLARTLTL